MSYSQQMAGSCCQVMESLAWKRGRASWSSATGPFPLPLKNFSCICLPCLPVFTYLSIGDTCSPVLEPDWVNSFTSISVPVYYSCRQHCLLAPQAQPTEIVSLAAHAATEGSVVLTSKKGSIRGPPACVQDM